METLIVYYWHGTQLLDNYYHQEELNFSKIKLYAIEDECHKNGLSYMVVPNETSTVIYIGKGRLTQR